MLSTTIIGLFIAIGLYDSPAQAQEFTLKTTEANTVSHRSSIDMPGLTGNPLAIIVATPIGNTTLLNPHPIGAWYYSGKWHIINSDQTRMPIGAQYHVQFFTEPGPNRFMHTVTPQNLGSEGTYIDNAALNKNPQARVKILQNYAPDVRTPYSLNRFEEKVSYSSAAGRWYIANKGGEPIYKGTVYNVVIEAQAPQTPGGSPGTPLTGPGADAKDKVKRPTPPSPPGGGTGGTPVAPGAPKSPEKPPTAAEIKEKLDKANEKLNEISKGVLKPADPTSANPARPSVLAKVSATAKMTGFDPEIHGFKFGNDFENTPFGPPSPIVSKGLCGGMSYTALDFFLAGVPIPKQDYRPSHSFPLQFYIYKRQETSLVENVIPWLDYHNNFLGARTLEIFNWGLREQLAELRSYIDRGVPVPLGLKWTGGDLIGKDHQVLAIGYDMGRYKGDVGAHIDELKIYLCEPNYPKMLITMVADPDTLEFYYVELPQVRWRSYFVDRAYRAKTPPTIQTPVEFQDPIKDGLTHALRLTFKTGATELLGGSVHLNLKIVFHDGTSQSYQNISQSGRWHAGYTERLEVVLTTPRRREDIRFFEFSTTGSAAYPGEWWDLETIGICAIGGGFTWNMDLATPGPYKFIGSNPQLVVPK